MLLKTQPWRDIMSKTATKSVIIVVMLCAGLLPSVAKAQGGPAYNNPSWGQYGITAWGSYQGQVGSGRWRYNEQVQPHEPVGTILADPNALNSSFANPRTGASLFQAPDTRLRGRDRP
jgi:hypothetical protein